MVSVVVVFDCEGLVGALGLEIVYALTVKGCMECGNEKRGDMQCVEKNRTDR